MSGSPMRMDSGTSRPATRRRPARGVRRRGRAARGSGPRARRGPRAPARRADGRRRVRRPPADANRSSATPSRNTAEPSGATASSTSRPPQRPRAAREPSGSRRSEEAGPRRVVEEGGQRREEPGLLDVRAAVLGTENVAVPAVVAGVRPVRDLVRRRPRAAAHERPDLRRHETSAPDDEIAIVDRPRGGLVREVRVVRADRDARVAVEAVEEVQVRAGLPRRTASGRVARVAERRGRRPAVIREGGLGDVAAASPAPAARRRTKSGSVAAPAAAHRRRESLGLPVEAGVPARAQEVGAARHGDEAAGDDVGDVRRVDPGREGERERRAERLAEPEAERSARAWSGSPERYASAPGRRPPVFTTTSVFVTFSPKPRPAARGRRRESARDAERVVPLEVPFEGLAAERHVRVRETAVEDLLDLLVAEERRVELDDRVEAALLEEMPADRVDLRGRAAVERRERDRVREALRTRHVGPAPQRGREARGAAPPAPRRGERARRAPRRRRRTSSATGSLGGRSRRRRRGPRRARRRERRTAPRGSRRGAAPSRTRGGSPRARAPATTRR